MWLITSSKRLFWQIFVLNIVSVLLTTVNPLKRLIRYFICGWISLLLNLWSLLLNESSFLMSQCCYLLLWVVVLWLFERRTNLSFFWIFLRISWFISMTVIPWSLELFFIVFAVSIWRYLPHHIKLARIIIVFLRISSLVEQILFTIVIICVILIKTLIQIFKLSSFGLKWDGWISVLRDSRDTGSFTWRHLLEFHLKHLISTVFTLSPVTSSLRDLIMISISAISWSLIDPGSSSSSSLYNSSLSKFWSLFIS